MSRKEIDVRMGAAGIPVGTLLCECDGRRETSVFRYAASWLNYAHAFPLSPFMPLQAAPYFGKKDRNTSSLPGPIEDGAPDSWGRKVIKKTKGRGHQCDIDFLLDAGNVTRIGALTYFDATAEKEPASAEASSEREHADVPMLHQLDEVVRAARSFDSNPDAFSERRGPFGESDMLRKAVGAIGGARPKINAIDKDGALWIVKVPKHNDTYAKARAEVLALRLANLVGIHVSEAHVLNDAPDFPLVLVKRFDRVGNNYETRVPFISAKTFVSEDQSDDRSYEDIAAALRTYGTNATQDIVELYRRMCFGILIRNTDDHLRNHGFLRLGGGWRLSPAFDINPDHRAGGYLQTSISEIHGAECSIASALDAAPFFDLRESEARLMIKAMADIISNRWREVGLSLQMTSQDLNAMKSILENSDVDAALRY